MNKPAKPRIFLENSPTVERLVPALAVAIGLNESIMLLQIDYWISISDNFEDGRWWTYQSVRDMREKAFPFWSIATITRTALSLEKQQLVTIGNFNQRSGDRTRWFAINDDGMQELATKVPAVQYVTPRNTHETPMKQDGNSLFQNETPFTQNETPAFQNETTLPEITTETTQRKAEEPRARIFRLYEDLCGQTISSFVYEELKDADKTYPADWIEDAFKEAALNNAKNWKYVRAILERWSREGKVDKKKSDKDNIYADFDRMKIITVTEEEAREMYGE